MVSWPLVRFTLLAIRRDRIVQLMLVLMALGTAMSLFLGSAATIEMQAFTVATAGTVLRVMAVLGLVVFICFFMRRSFDSREIDYLLATPLTRNKLLLSFAAAFMLLAVLLTALIGGVMGFLIPKLSDGWIFWTASVLVELTVTAMMALFFSSVLRSATIATLCSFGYYTLSRMMGLLIGILETKLSKSDPLIFVSNYVIKVISVVTPRFDLMAQSAWLVYGRAAGLDVWVLPVQFAVFSFLFFTCAAFDLRRVQF